MKNCIVVLLFTLFSINGSAQDDITGQWYSEDSTRVYHIYRRGNEYEAILEHTSRANERSGAYVLVGLSPNQKRRKYAGDICAVSDGLTTRVKVKMSNDGGVLCLRLSRMFIMPVRIKWYRKSLN